MDAIRRALPLAQLSLALLLAAGRCYPRLHAQSLPTHIESDPVLKAARAQLAARHFAEAKRAFVAYRSQHPESLEAQLGEADADLGLHEYESAEIAYRRLVARQPQLWLAHRNLVLVEAALGRWDEFDRERALLHDARRRGVPGIGALDSDLIDTFTVNGQHWIVRAYDEPAGRSHTRYNFERFSAQGRVEAFLSLESASAAATLWNDPTALTAASTTEPQPPIHDFALNWYTGAAHGTIHAYPGPEPTYEQVRADALRWIRSHAAPVPRGAAGQAHIP